ncbi:MAG: shikimate kinase [Candidatus Scalinduaceae bacterium]
MNIVLIGFRGTGKSTVGKLLADRLKRDYVDTDEYIEGVTGKTIKYIFKEEGEEGFRKTEADAVAKLSKMDDKIIAAGGGVVLRNDNVKKLKNNGFLILLEATPEIIHNRIKQDVKTTNQRPSLTSKKPFDEIKHLIEQRQQLYENAADYTINTSYISCEDVAEEIVTFLKDQKNR